MFEPFRYNISTLFNWSDTQFDLFNSLWEQELHNNIGMNRAPFIYTTVYMESLLSVYFVIQQQDLKLQRLLVNDKAVFLASICFYLVEDLKLQQQTEKSEQVLFLFFNKLKENNLVAARDVSKVSALLHCFSAIPVDVFASADNVTQMDLSILTDILLFHDPIVIFNRACMFYYGDVKKTFFKFLKEDVNILSPTLFFDSCFSRSQKINNKFVKRLFVENYHHLMEIQNKDKIFPF